MDRTRTPAPQRAEAAATIEAKVAWLSRPEAWPDRPTRVEVVETHMSWVFLTRDHAYKLKKPVRYEFLDFSTIEARRHDCEEEVRLNRRLAGDVYLGVVPLVRADGGFRLGGEGEVVDWLVRMRRLPEDRTLLAVIRAGRAREEDLRPAFTKLARFYQMARPLEIGVAEYWERIATDVRDNGAAVADPAFGLPPEPAHKVTRAGLDFLDRNRALFDRRVLEWRIIEAHGDLRPEHIYLLPEPVIVDCLEFNLSFRTVDAADELAFLAMECEALGAPEVGALAFSIYGEVTGDRPPEKLVAFYKCARALLRAKLAIWHLREPGAKPGPQWPQRAMSYLRLAENYLPAMA